MKRIFKQSSQAALIWILSAAKQQLFNVLILTLLGSAVSILSVVFALVLRDTVDGAVSGESRRLVSGITILCVIVLVKLLFGAISRRLDEAVRCGVENELKLRCYRTILTRDYASLRPFHTGELNNRMTNDTSIIAQSTAAILPGTAAMIVKLIGAASVLVVLDHRFALVFMIGGGLLLVVTYMFRRVMKRLHKRVQEADGNVRSFLQETLASLLVIRSFGGETKSADEAEKLMNNHRRERMYRNLFSNLCNIGFGALMQGGYLFGLIWCGYGILNGHITYGTLSAVMQLVGQIQSPLANISGYLPRYYAMLASAERLMELEALMPDNTEGLLTKAETASLYLKLQRIRLSGVRFVYPGYEENCIFDNCSICIEKGKLTAIVGPSGTGKSTLLKLLLAVYRPTAGNIGFEINTGGMVAVTPTTRPMFAYVPQGNFLLSGKICESISLTSSDEIDMQKLQYACKVACADFIEQLSDRYDTMIGEKGEGLSEGQNQRLAIARAIYSDAPILLLDESTSALDETSERRVLGNLRELTDKTVVIVTHRHAALEVCNKIYHLKDNQFVEADINA